MRDRVGTGPEWIRKQGTSLQTAAAKGKYPHPSGDVLGDSLPASNHTARKRIVAELEQRVRDFTAELRATNEALLAEISEREKTEEALRRESSELQVHRIELEMQNEELLRLHTDLAVSQSGNYDLYDLAPVGYLTLSAEGVIVESNLMAATLLGKPESDLINQPLTGFILPEDQDMFARHRQEISEKNTPQACELRMLRKDGAPFWARIATSVKQETDGASVCRLTISDITECKRLEDRERLVLEALQAAHDKLESLVASRTATLKETVLQLQTEIEERRRGEEALRRSEENFRRSLDESPLGVRIVTIDGDTLYANRAMLEIYGYKGVDELRTTPVIERYPAESYAEFKERFAKRLRGEYVPAEYDINIVRKDGEVRHLRVFRRAVVWDGNEQFQAIYYDITERRRMVEALRKREEELAAESLLLAETNTALRVILNRRDEDIREMEKKIVANVEKSVLPYLGEIRKHSPTPATLNYLDIAESNLRQIISPFLTNLAARFSAFTPREIAIANLIKDDMSSKEIAETLNISARSVEFHRNNIRRKLGLAHKANNLRSFLLSLSK